MLPISSLKSMSLASCQFPRWSIHMPTLNGKIVKLGCCIIFGTFDIVVFWDTWTPLDDIDNIAKHKEICNLFVVHFVLMLCNLLSIRYILLSPSTMPTICWALISPTSIQLPPQCCSIPPGISSKGHPCKGGCLYKVGRIGPLHSRGVWWDSCGRNVDSVATLWLRDRWTIWLLIHWLALDRYPIETPTPPRLFRTSQLTCTRCLVRCYSSCKIILTIHFPFDSSHVWLRRAPQDALPTHDTSTMILPPPCFTY